MNNNYSQNRHLTFKVSMKILNSKIKTKLINYNIKYNNQNNKIML